MGYRSAGITATGDIARLLDRPLQSMMKRSQRPWKSWT